MTEIALTLIADYGVIVLFCVTFLSCLALPVPSALLSWRPAVLRHPVIWRLGPWHSRHSAALFWVTTWAI